MTPEELAKLMAGFLAELAILSAFIIAAVGWLKSLGVQGNALTISAFAFGLVLGVGYRYATAPMTDFASWFFAILFGLLAGFFATGAYKTGEALALKGNSQFTPAKPGVETPIKPQ